MSVTMHRCVSLLSQGGYQQLVRGEPFRAKFRHSFEEPVPLTPGQPTRIEFTMPDVCHTFRRGHRIAVHVQSTWFPLVRATTTAPSSALTRVEPQL